MSFGLNTAVSGLLTAKRGLYTASHNIDNTTTPGYSRQRIYQNATNAHHIPQDGFLGTGTSIDNIGRIRNSFIDFKYWYECAPTAEWSSKNETLDEVQKILGEPSKASFSKYMDDLYDSLNNLKKNPGDLAYREPVRENAKAFARHLNETAGKLLQLQKDTLQESRDVVDKVNALAHQIANLNRQIYEQEIGGRIANDLRDRRDLIVDELSKYVSVSVSETYPTSKDGKPDYGTINNTESLYGKFDVSVGGISLVNHTYVNEIQLKKWDYKDYINSLGSSSIWNSDDFDTNKDAYVKELNALKQYFDATESEMKAKYQKLLDECKSLADQNSGASWKTDVENKLNIFNGLPENQKTLEKYHETLKNCVDKMETDNVFSKTESFKTLEKSYSGLKDEFGIFGQLKQMRVDVEDLTKNGFDPTKLNTFINTHKDKVLKTHTEFFSEFYQNRATGDGHDVYEMYWSNGSKVYSHSGKAKSLLDLYNGNGRNGSYRGIAFYRSKLDDFAYGFAKKFNEQHKKGYSLGIDGNDGKTGIDFFKDLGSDKTNAAMKIELSEDILKDIRNIAAAGEPGGKPEDNKNLLALIKQREDIHFFNSDVGDNISQGTPEDFIKSMISIVGVDKQQSHRFETTQKMLEKNLQTRRLSISGVNLNEEMGEMVKYQKVYAASAKMISTMDHLLDLTVNRLGLVGR